MVRARSAASPTRSSTLPITGLPVPAAAEIVLEGYIHADKMAPEGPFGEWTGYYGDLRPAEPVLTVEALYHRNDPIMLGVPPNKPPAYDPYLYREYLRAAILLRELQGPGIPGIIDAQLLRRRRNPAVQRRLDPAALRRPCEADAARARLVQRRRPTWAASSRSSTTTST